MNLGESASTPQVVANGSVATVLTVVARDTIYTMLPYIGICILIIIADLYYGIKASKKRGETIRTSRAIRRTCAKIFEYLCWIVIGSGLAVAFEISWFDKVVVGIAMGIECISLVTNALYCKGYKISGLEKTLIKHIGDKHGVNTDGINIEKDNE